MVGADPQRAAELAQPAHERAEALGGVLHLLGVLRVAVVAHLELLLVGVVARVDPDLLDVLGRDQRGARRVVDVGDERHAHAAPAQLGADRGEVLGLLARRRGDPRDLAARGGEPLHLVGGARGVERVGGRHRLHAHGLVAADRDVAHAHDPRPPPARRERARRVARGHA